MEWYEFAKRRMEEIGLIQDDFVKPLGKKTRGAVSHYFNGLRTPTPHQFKTIADMLELTMDQLFAGNVPSTALAGPRALQRPEEFFIPQLPELAGSMGEGIEEPDHFGVVNMVRVNLPELRREISFTSPQNLRIITGKGDSMDPTFKDGDPIIVDTGVHEITIEAVYVFKKPTRAHDDIFIKRISRQPIDDTLLISSDNPAVRQTTVISEEEFKKHFKLIGRALIAWNARKL